MRLNTEKPDIFWITNKRTDGEEWITYIKNINTTKPIKTAVIRFENDCICAVYVNDKFIISGNGRTPGRVNCHEITSKLASGNNIIKVVLGGAYFQQKGYDVSNSRGYMLSSFAMEICVEYTDGTKLIVPTNSTWTADINGLPTPAMETMPVTDAEYNTMWCNATPWIDTAVHKVSIPDAVVNVVGKEYVDYANQTNPEYIYPTTVVETNMKLHNGSYIPDSDKDEIPYIIYDFSRLTVGYTELEYNAECDTEAVLNFDFSETITDFEHDPSNQWIHVIQSLIIKQNLKLDETLSFNPRRRAFRFIKIEFDKNAQIELHGISVKPCLFPAEKHGWFTCSDNELNKMWEIGKYTLHVNKQQEYESCPRNEMEFFSGDGYIDALIDLYAFGEEKLLNTSLNLVFPEACIGLTHTADFNKSRHQWDYYAWRIVCVYTHYKITGDIDFVKKQFATSEKALQWQLNRMGKNNLIFQPPCFISSYTYTLGQVDWACSPSRLGEKPYLNALLYKSLTSMSEMAAAIGEIDKSNTWSNIASQVKKAINDKLWSEENQCYMDSMDDYISQDGNIIPVLFGVTDERKTKAIFNTLKQHLWTPYGATILNKYVPHTRGGNTTISPLMCAYEAETRFVNNDADNALELIRRCWGNMLKKGANTFWEFSPNNDKDWWDAVCHAWSAGCTYLLSAYVLGIRMTKPDFAKIVFQPNVCDLTHISGVVPTSSGFIAASYKTDENNIKIFKLAVPKDTEVECILPDNSKIEIIKY